MLLTFEECVPIRSLLLAKLLQGRTHFSEYLTAHFKPTEVLFEVGSEEIKVQHLLDVANPSGWLSTVVVDAYTALLNHMYGPQFRGFPVLATTNRRAKIPTGEDYTRACFIFIRNSHFFTIGLFFCCFFRAYLVRCRGGR